MIIIKPRISGINMPQKNTFYCCLRSIMSQNLAFESRLVAKKFLVDAQRQGPGAVIRKCIGRTELKILDPFLILDDFQLSPPGGFPDHPHRGFETVTYMLQGGIAHEDFSGHKGTVHAGDVQWMTAGRGIVHSELAAGDGLNTGLQLWINLYSKYKMIEPRYQELLDAEIPRVEKDGVVVKIIAGESLGVHSRVHTQTPTMFLDFTLKPNSEYHQIIPNSWNAFVYTLEGEGVFCTSDSHPTPANNILVLGSGDGLSVWNNSATTLRFILIGGQPLNEPVVQHGPFVMNTQAEVDQAMEDYSQCKNGFENAKTWRSN